jgi:hypothetical protein
MISLRHCADLSSLVRLPVFFRLDRVRTRGPGRFVR